MRETLARPGPGDLGLAAPHGHPGARHQDSPAGPSPEPGTPGRRGGGGELGGKVFPAGRVPTRSPASPRFANTEHPSTQAHTRPALPVAAANFEPEPPATRFCLSPSPSGPAGSSWSSFSASRPGEDHPQARASPRGPEPLASAWPLATPRGPPRKALLVATRPARALPPPLPRRAFPGRPARPFTCFGLAAPVQSCHPSRATLSAP